MSKVNGGGRVHRPPPAPEIPATRPCRRSKLPEYDAPPRTRDGWSCRHGHSCIRGRTDAICMDIHCRNLTKVDARHRFLTQVGSSISHGVAPWPANARIRKSHSTRKRRIPDSLVQSRHMRQFALRLRPSTDKFPPETTGSRATTCGGRDGPGCAPRLPPSNQSTLPGFPSCLEALLVHVGQTVDQDF